MKPFLSKQPIPNSPYVKKTLSLTLSIRPLVRSTRLPPPARVAGRWRGGGDKTHRNDGLGPRKRPLSNVTHPVLVRLMLQSDASVRASAVKPLLQKNLFLTPRMSKKTYS